MITVEWNETITTLSDRLINCRPFAIRLIHVVLTENLICVFLWSVHRVDKTII